MNENKKITEYLAITKEPETVTVGNYNYDALIGVKIPNKADIDLSKVQKCEIRISPNANVPGVEKSGLDIAKLIIRNEEKLKSGELYAKVECFMSARQDQDGIVRRYVPYLNNIELVTVDEVTKPFVDTALRSVNDGGL